MIVYFWQGMKHYALWKKGSFKVISLTYVYANLITFAQISLQFCPNLSKFAQI